MLAAWFGAYDMLEWLASAADLDLEEHCKPPIVRSQETALTCVDGL